jgi:hypothetical protein
MWAGRYAADKGFDPIIQIGDWGDFQSQSSYDKGKRSAEGRRLSKDWDAMRASVDRFMAPLDRNGKLPRLVYTKGNHEFRIDRAIEDNPNNDTLPDVLQYMADRGWEVYDYLEVAKVEGVLVSHLFPLTLNGRVTNSSKKYGAPSASHMVRANMASCIAGHKPGYDVAMHPGPANRMLCGLIAGSFYLHRETYNGPGYDNQWKGVVALNRLHKGRFDACPVSIEYLKETYA